jgi:hypothetical protein
MALTVMNELLRVRTKETVINIRRTISGTMYQLYNDADETVFSPKEDTIGKEDNGRKRKEE